MWRVLWCREPALDVELGPPLLYGCKCPVRSSRTWNRSFRTRFWAAGLGRWDGSAPWQRCCPSGRVLCGVACHLCAGSHRTPLLAPPSTPPQPWECRPSSPVSLSRCFFTRLLKSGPRTSVVGHGDPLCEIWRPLWLWPSPGPQLLRPDLPITGAPEGPQTL